MEINPFGRTVLARRRFYAQETPNKSKQTRRAATRRRIRPRYLRFRKGRGFIYRCFGRRHMARWHAPNHACFRAHEVHARRVNYLDKSSRGLRYAASSNHRTRAFRFHEQLFFTRPLTNGDFRRISGCRSLRLFLKSLPDLFPSKCPNVSKRLLPRFSL